MRSSARHDRGRRTSVNADDPESPARTASLTTRPSVESTFVVRKSVSRIGSRSIQSTRTRAAIRTVRRRARASPMNTRDDAMNAPNAYMPPRAVRYQLTCGAALSAIVAIVPCVVDRRSARRVRRRRRHRASRHALHVAGPQHHGQAERHHDERAREHPIGQSDADDRGLRDDRDDDERRRRRSRAPSGTCPGRRAAPAGIAGVRCRW